MTTDHAARLTLPRHDLRRADGRMLHVYGPLHGRLGDSAGDGGARSSVHLRHDPLTGEWVVVSPARNERPLTATRRGRAAGDTAAPAPAACPLCPGGPEVPFPYMAAVFDNRFPSLLPHPPTPPHEPPLDGLALTAPAAGRCEVVLYTDQHQGSLATLTPEQVARVVAIWRDRSQALWGVGHPFVLIFENRGEAVGATLSHPHGQIYAFGHLPPLIAARAERHRLHRERSGSCLGCAVTALDTRRSERTILSSPSFTVAVPFAPRWPYEVHVRARRHGARRLGDLGTGEQRDLAQALQAVVQRYDGLFGFELPYMMVALEAPDGQPDWHLSFEFLPPHRAPDKLKIRASVETVTGTFINDTVPEARAAALAAVPVPPASWDDVEVPHVEPVGVAP